MYDGVQAPLKLVGLTDMTRIRCINQSRNSHEVGEEVEQEICRKLASVPIEYQASVYAKEIKLQHQEKQIENKENLAKHRSLLKSLEKKFQEEKSEESRAILLNEIEIQKKIINRAPRPKRKWSPILSGSFESNSR